MATVYKTLTNNDTVSTRTLLHEAIPMTGSIVSGTYSDLNIKNYAHGMFQSVYDYPYLSSSANHIFDITLGYSSKSPLSSSTGVQNSKKINIYNQMAQVLMGYDATGSVQRFDEDGDILAGGTKIDSCYFLNFSRLLVKDEIKKGSFQMTLMVSGANAAITSATSATANGHKFPSGDRVLVHDSSASNDFRVNSPAGEYGILQAVNETAGVLTTQNVPVGLIYYQAGIVVLTGSVLLSSTSGGRILATDGDVVMDTMGPNSAGAIGASVVSRNITNMMTGSSITGSADALRRRIYNIQFNNTTELNSTIYFCRINHNDYNYSSNPTYMSGSKIRVKNTRSDAPSSYITTVGLYSADNELLAVAKVSEPLKKDPTNELTLRVRLDY